MAVGRLEDQPARPLLDEPHFPAAGRRLGRRLAGGDINHDIDDARRGGDGEVGIGHLLADIEGKGVWRLRGQQAAALRHQQPRR